MKRVVIMGASSGIGREVALRFIHRGYQVGLAARRSEILEELQEQYPNQVATSCIDITQDIAAEQLLSLIDEIGGVDLYFHAAGIGWQNPQLDSVKELMTANTNVMGFTRMVDTVFNYMRSHGGGHIAVISSIAGTKGLGPAPAYSATKSFQNTYIQSLEQLSNSLRLKIRFTDIRPGFVDTALLSGRRYPMLMRPEKVADDIVSSVVKQRHVRVIDWRYRILVPLWRLVPNCLWRNISLLAN